MNYILETVKIHLSENGFLPELPYHLISDKELFDAFVPEDTSSGVFSIYYPEPDGVSEDETLHNVYTQLPVKIREVCYQYLHNEIDDLPDWVYYYLVQSTIGTTSDEQNIRYFSDLVNYKNTYGIFDLTLANYCYSISHSLNSITSEDRPDTIFADPDVVKYARIQSVV